MGRILAVALIAAWLATIACADAQPEMHRLHVPCCPRDAGTPECCMAQCAAVQAPEKKEGQSDERVVKMPVANAAPADWAVTRRAGLSRELTPGLRFAAAVFRLKDDLRI